MLSLFNATCIYVFKQYCVSWRKSIGFLSRDATTTVDTMQRLGAFPHIGGETLVYYTNTKHSTLLLGKKKLTSVREL